MNRLLLRVNAYVAAALLLSCAARKEPQPTPVSAGSAAEQYAQGIRLLVHPDGSLNQPDQAYPWLLAAAQQGLPNAQAMLGLCTQFGWGVEPDEKAAMAWYKKAARQGQNGAAMQLARSFRNRNNSEEAVKWLEMSLAKGRGTPEAHVLMASLCFRRREEQKAVTHLRYAAMDGHAEAAYLMALCYEVGAGVPKNEQLMLGWLKSAAEMGYKPAKTLLSELQAQPPLPAAQE